MCNKVHWPSEPLKVCAKVVIYRSRHFDRLNGPWQGEVHICPYDTGWKVPGAYIEPCQLNCRKCQIHSNYELEFGIWIFYNACINDIRFSRTNGSVIRQKYFWINVDNSFIHLIKYFVEIHILLFFIVSFNSCYVPSFSQIW